MRHAFSVRRPSNGLVASWTLAGLSTVALLCGSSSRALAQDPVESGAAGPVGSAAATPADPGQDPVGQEPLMAVPTADAVTGPLATVLVDKLALSVWPTATSPVYADEVIKGTVLRVGETRDGFRQVLLPVGPQGFVHEKFTSAPQGSKLVTKGKAVSFRYRPQSGEAPVTTLAEGTELWVVGKHEDWWRVRYPARDCWVPADSVQVFDEGNETMRKAYVEFAKVQHGEVAAYAAAEREKVAAAEREVELRQQLTALLDQFQQELAKPPAEQQLDPVASATDAMLVTIGAESAMRPALLDLQRRIATQRWVQAAVSVVDERPVPVQDLPEPASPLVRDPLDRFQAVGFLRWERGLVGPGHFVVEKGGHPLYIVTCNSSRYDLALFVDHEVGLVGSRRRPATESLRVLDVEKIEVLSPGR